MLYCDAGHDGSTDTLIVLQGRVISRKGEGGHSSGDMLVAGHYLIQGGVEATTLGVSGKYTQIVTSKVIQIMA